MESRSFALTVDDAWKAFCVVAHYDDADAYSKSIPCIGFGATPPVLKIGVPATADRRFFGDDAMEASFEDAIAAVAKLGHQVIEIPFGNFYKVANLLYDGAWVAERYAAVKDFFDNKEESFHPVTRKIYAGAKTLSAADAFNGLYALQALKRKVAPVIDSVDLFCVPTAPRHYRRAEVEAEPIRENSRLGTYTNFVNLLDMCGIAVPTGTRSDGLPASVTLLARSGRDGLTASLARDIHQASGLTLGATNWPVLPIASSTIPTDGLINLVVVGAHLSGMPLNRQLRELDAHFLSKSRTSASYRLYELAGQQPAKPGLIRVEEDKGGEIEVEIWQLTPAAFGQFVAAIPAPLGIGTISLADGTAAKGFLAEATALKGAVDITNHGGWRAYVEANQSARKFERTAS